MFGNYEMLWKAIIRPPRAEYSPYDIGPKVFKKNGMKIKRTQVELKNKRGHKLVCSHYQPYNRPCKLLPCVIYLHGNSSCQIQAQQCITSILCHEASLFAFDFSGCGISQGQYISLGYHESEDVDVIYHYLRDLGTVSSIGIWGRSMGAVTALMYADRNHEIACLVLDSPFSNLQVLCKELAKKYAGGLSTFSGIALTFLSKTIKQKNNFNIEDIDPIKHVKKAFIPALFIAAEGDDFILPHHTQKLHAAYSGEKQKIIVQGDHNSNRAQDVFDKISSFFYFGLCISALVQPDKQFMEEQKKEKVDKEEETEIKAYDFGAYHVEHHFEPEEDEEEQLKKAIAESLKLEEGEKEKKEEEKKEE